MLAGIRNEALAHDMDTNHHGDHYGMCGCLVPVVIRHEGRAGVGGCAGKEQNENHRLHLYDHSSLGVRLRSAWLGADQTVGMVHRPDVRFASFVFTSSNRGISGRRFFDDSSQPRRYGSNPQYVHTVSDYGVRLYDMYGAVVTDRRMDRPNVDVKGAAVWIRKLGSFA